jgi:hypothetical protein
MNFNDDDIAGDRDNQTQTTENIKPNAYRVDDGAGLDEKDLEKSYLFGKGDNPANPTEGKSEGGQNFGKENLTPAGDDKNNPSQNAGYTNAYFARNEPSDEHPEDSNFTAAGQDGAPKPEKVERGNGENDRPHPQQPYTEGTDDNDGTDGPNIPGPQELPDQQKVGEDDEDHIET